MATFIVTYDLQRATPDPHSEFLEQGAHLGWKCWILAQGTTWYRLPNTTFVGEFANRDAAIAAFKKVWAQTAAKGYSVTVEKWIVAEYSGASFGSDVTQPRK